MNVFAPRTYDQYFIFVHDAIGRTVSYNFIFDADNKQFSILSDHIAFLSRSGLALRMRGRFSDGHLDIYIEDHET